MQSISDELNTLVTNSAYVKKYKHEKSFINVEYAEMDIDTQLSIGNRSYGNQT